jgi:predicted RNA-binding Zn ribbon-like protein
MWTATAFLGGHPALDFLNTAGGSSKDRGVERLTDFGVAAGWAHAAGVIDDAEHHDLLAVSATDPAEAVEAVTELRGQREALHAFLLAGIDGTDCSVAVRERVTADITAGYRTARLSHRLHDDPAWVVTEEQAGLRLIAIRLALAGGALLAGGQRDQIRVCGRCSWMFLDPSPTRRRRWCSMAICGNRAKVQRHQQRGPSQVEPAGRSGEP